MPLQRAAHYERDPKDRIFLVKSGTGETIGGVGTIEAKKGKRTNRRWLAICRKCGPITTIEEAEGSRERVMQEKQYLSKGEAARAVKCCKHETPLDHPLNMTGPEQDDDDD